MSIKNSKSCNLCSVGLKLPDQNWTFSTNVPVAPARPAERSST